VARPTNALGRAESPCSGRRDPSRSSFPKDRRGGYASKVGLPMRGSRTFSYHKWRKERGAEKQNHRGGTILLGGLENYKTDEIHQIFWL